MRATARCPKCAAFVREGVTEDGRMIVLIDPDAVEYGTLWVLDWDGGDPTVRVEASPEDVPASVPLRYTPHLLTCVGEPR